MQRNQIGKIAVEEHVTFPGGTKYLIDLETKVSPERLKRIGGLVDVLADLGDRRLEAMASANVSCAVLSLVTPGVQAELDRAKAVRIAKQLNDELAAAMGSRTAFAGLAHLPMQDSGAAADELERCVVELGFVGFMVNGHTCGAYLDAPTLDVVWERAVALGVPLYLHPAYAVNIPEVLRQPSEMGGALWGWMAETGGHALRMMLNGVFDRNPGLQVILGHMGEALPFLSWRLDRGVKRMEAERRPGRLPSEYLVSNIHATTSGVLSTPALRCTLDTIGQDRVMFAIDYPFEESAPAGEWLDEAEIADEAYLAIARENALRLFPGLAARIGVQGAA